MELVLRRATIEDAEVIFEWRNDPVTRLSSHNTEAIDFSSHVAWFRATLENPMRQLLIAEQDGVPVGTVRTDYDANGSAELSWTIAPGARGQGIAKHMVKAVADEVAKKCVVKAEVKVGNTASVKVAEAAGMQMARQDGEILHFRRMACV